MRPAESYRAPERPAGLRAASTVVLMRQREHGPEVLMVQRAAKGDMPGAWVFPGGVIEAGDHAPGTFAQCRSGLAAAQWARFGMESAERVIAHYVAACRETYEETGILLARSLQEAASGADRGSVTGSRKCRESLLQGRCTFEQVLGELGLRPAVEDLIYFAHWITPEALARRFDTRFFLAECLGAVEAEPDGTETVEVRWISAEGAIAQLRAGAMSMVNATIKTLELLAHFGSVAEAGRAMRDRQVQPVLPKAVRHREGLRIVNPWEAGYSDIP